MILSPYLCSALFWGALSCLLHGKVTCHMRTQEAWGSSKAGVYISTQGFKSIPQLCQTAGHSGWQVAATVEDGLWGQKGSTLFILASFFSVSTQKTSLTVLLNLPWIFSNLVQLLVKGQIANALVFLGYLIAINYFLLLVKNKSTQSPCMSDWQGHFFLFFFFF